MPLKRISLPGKINFPVRITEVHVSAGQFVSKGDPIYTLEASNGKRGVMKSPFAGEITEGPVAVDATFMTPTSVIGILIKEPETPKAPVGDAPGHSASTNNSADRPFANEAPKQEFQDKTELPSSEDNPQAHAPEVKSRGLLSTLTGVLVFLIIGALAALMPGLIYGTPDLHSIFDPRFSFYTASLGFVLVVITAMAAFAKMFGGKLVLPVFGVLMVFAAATFAGYHSDEFRNTQMAAMQPAQGLFQELVGRKDAPVKNEVVEAKQVTRLPGNEETYGAGATDPYYGEIRAFAFNFCPRGWTEANGLIVPVELNHALFSLFGTNYGGDGRSGFGMPDLRGREIRGYEKTDSVMNWTSEIGSRGGQNRMEVKSGTKYARFGQSSIAIQYCVSLGGVYPSRP